MRTGGWRPFVFGKTPHQKEQNEVRQAQLRFGHSNPIVVFGCSLNRLEDVVIKGIAITQPPKTVGTVSLSNRRRSVS